MTFGKCIKSYFLQNPNHFNQTTSSLLPILLFIKCYYVNSSTVSSNFPQVKLLVINLKIYKNHYIINTCLQQLFSVYLEVSCCILYLRGRKIHKLNVLVYAYWSINDYG